MNIFFDVPLGVVLPPFAPREEQRGENGGLPLCGVEGGNMPRPIRSNPQTKHRAIELRRESTPAERKLWSRIRNDQLGVTFRRHTCPGGRCQGHAIGNYIPDFCAPRKKLIIELDGSQHMEQEGYDTERTEYLESKGYTVLRFWNNNVINDIDSVIRAIIQAMEPERHL